MLKVLKSLAGNLRYQLTRQFKGGDVAARLLGVKVGTGCRILTSRFGSEPWLIKIGDRVTVTNGVTFLTHDGSTWLIRDEQGRRYRYARIEIGSDVFIGVNAILMPGIRVGDRVIIGAGSVVTKSVPSGAIVAGNPARIVGAYADYEARAKAGFATDATMGAGIYQERILRVVEPGFRPEMPASPRPERPSS